MSVTKDDFLGEEVAGCTLSKVLGSGALATVYLGARADGRKLAIKIMHMSSAETPDQVARFEREAQLCYQIRHKNLIPVHTWGRIDDRPYLVMDWVHGATLDRLVEHHDSRLDWWITATLMQQIAEALDHVHSVGVLHRDIKPGNIMVGRDGIARLGDLGLARRLRTNTDTNSSDETIRSRRLTVEGAAIGSPAYMAPEQVMDGVNSSYAADIYSFGATLYFACVGKPPLYDKNVMGTLKKVVTEEPRRASASRPGLPKGMTNLIAQCLDKKPHKRPPNAATIAERLKDLIPRETKK